MKSIYFPFTYISKQAAETICSCFSQIDIYQPTAQGLPEEMAQLAESHSLGVRTPVITDDHKLDAVCENFTNWIHLHGGTQAHLLKTENNATPFFNESSTLQIKSTIKKGEIKEKPDPDFLARVFLKFTQDFDRQNTEIVKDLKSYENMEQNLFNTLKGEEAYVFKADAKNDRIEDHGAYMTDERLTAWTRLMLFDPTAPDLFVTTSPSVINLLLDKTPGAKQILKLDSISLSETNHQGRAKWKKSLIEYIDRLGKNDVPELPSSLSAPPDLIKSTKTTSFSLFLVEGETPCDFFTRCTDLRFPKSEMMKREKHPDHTLFGCIVPEQK